MVGILAEAIKLIEKISILQAYRGNVVDTCITFNGGSGEADHDGITSHSGHCGERELAWRIKPAGFKMERIWTESFELHRA